MPEEAFVSTRRCSIFAWRSDMAELTAEQITTLTNLGARRWRRGDMDRLYLNAHIYASRGDASCDDEATAEAFRRAKVWVDTRTGRLCVRGVSQEHERLIRRNAEQWLSDAYGQVEWQVAEKRAKSIKSVALKWRKGNELTLEGKRFVVVRADTLSSPSEDRSHMLCDVRIIVPQFDGRYRRVDLNEA